jgi:general secretion pathway protein E
MPALNPKLMTPSDVEIWHAIRRETNTRSGRVLAEDQPGSEWSLVADGALSESELLDIYQKHSGISVKDDRDVKQAVKVHEITAEFLSENICVPVAWEDGSATFVVALPYSTEHLRYLVETNFGKQAEIALARRSVVEQMLGRLYLGKQDDAVGDGAPIGTFDSEDKLRKGAQDAFVVKAINSTIVQACESGASDIHIERGENETVVRFRIDGVLQKINEFGGEMHQAFASRIKILAGLDIAKRRIPQDGRFTMPVRRKAIDVRVSTIPGIFGESIVLRLLQKEDNFFELHNLGLSEAHAKLIGDYVRRPHGMILMAGPTGSGKTTTLYSALRLLDSEKLKIITIEDPVEYEFDGITQIRVDPQVGLTFANGLRSIVRQDPDVILVGEIRDPETAGIAIQAALTGHLVLSTIHTNDAAGAVSRLLEMGVESYLLSSALIAVMSQRLVRKLCRDCGGEGVISEDSQRCAECNGTGYIGRTAVFEFMPVDEAVREAIRNHSDSSQIAKIAKEYGMQTLFENAEEKCRQGITTETEIRRVLAAV